MNAILGKLIKKGGQLPTMPTVVQEMERLLADENIPMDSVINLLETDPVLASRVLRIANSSFYGMASEVYTVKKAVLILGLSSIKSIVITTAASSMFSENFDHSFDIRGLWLHSLGCAVAARNLARQSAPEVTEQSYICGMLHDIGKIAIINNLSREMLRIYARNGDGKEPPMSKIEYKLLGFTHSDVGEILTKSWRFPEEYHLVIKYHHRPDEPRKELEDGPKEPDSTVSSVINNPSFPKLLYSVYAGNAVAKILELGKSLDETIPEIDSNIWKMLCVSEDKLPGIYSVIQEEFEALTSCLL